MFGSRSYHQENDFKVVMGVGADMMQDLADGESRFWSNPQTGNAGTITMIRSYERNGLPCRDAKLTSDVGQRSVVYVLPVCRIADGTWKFASR